MRSLFLISKEDFINLIKNPMWVFYTLIFPIVLVMILGFLTKDLYGSDVNSYDYYGITLMIYTILTSGMTSANAFMEDRIKKPNMRIIYTPGYIGNIYISKIIASFVFSFVLHLIAMIFLCSTFKIVVNAIPQMFILFVLMELFSVTLGVMICCILKTEELTNQILSVVIHGVAIVGGLFFSLDGYGNIIRKVSLLSPAKWISDASFQMIYDGNFNLFMPTVIILIMSIIVMLWICSSTFKKEDCLC